MTTGLTQTNLGRQYIRRVRLEIGPPGKAGRSWTDLRVNWSVEKTDKKRPNKSKVQVYNLNGDSRGFVEGEGLAVRLFAGLEEDPPLIFSGAIDEVEHQWADRDIVTVIEARDGSVAWSTAALETWEPPLDTARLLERLASAMGVGLRQVPADLPNVDYPSGFSLTGAARDALSEVLTPIGASWSIQDGEIVVTLTNEPARTEAFLASPTTGLIGSPEKTKEGIKFTMLLNGRVRPTDLVRVESRKYTGFYVAKKVTHSGDSGWDDAFYTEVEASAL